MGMHGMGCLTGCIVPTKRNLETGTAAPIRDSATARLGNRRVENRDRGIFGSLFKSSPVTSVHCSGGASWRETARDSACREPAAEKCTCHSFRRRATLPLG